MLPMHFMSPHVLSTQEEPSETTMGFTRQYNINSLIKSRRTIIPAAATIHRAAAPTTTPVKRSKMHRSRIKFLVHELLRQCIVVVIDDDDDDDIDGWQSNRFNHPNVSNVLCIDEKTERTPNANIVPSCRKRCIRWTINTLCSCAAGHNRWRRTACDRLPNMAMARFAIGQRIETDTVLSERNGSGVCVLQSKPLESTESTRYLMNFDQYIYIYFCMYFGFV